MARQAARAVSLTVKMIPSKMIVEKDTFLIDDIFNSHALNATVSCRFIAFFDMNFMHCRVGDSNDCDGPNR